MNETQTQGKRVPGGTCAADCSILRHERLLAQALLNVLVTCGMLNEDAAPTGPELLMFAEQFSGRKTDVVGLLPCEPLEDCPGWVRFPPHPKSNK